MLPGGIDWKVGDYDQSTTNPAGCLSPPQSVDEMATMDTPGGGYCAGWVVDCSQLCGIEG